MGIAVQELLSMEYFKDFYVVAGQRGIHKEVQGVTLLEAPDAFRWGKGKELVLSSGYVLVREPDAVKKAFEEGSIQKSAAMMIKRGRYLDHIPEEMKALFDQYEIPLISMPFSIPWMELMSQINVAVMNRTIRRFRIQQTDIFSPSRQTYKVQKIQRILQAVEVEMDFPAFLYDIREETGYYSSVNFKRITESFGLVEKEYWEPSLPHTKHTLCDYINMVRYRLINRDNVDGPRVSWIIIPIVMNKVAVAYFVVMESREFLDYYDEYSIRIAFLILQGIYEQIMVAQSIGDIGFENFIHFILSYNEPDKAQLLYQANIQGIPMSVPYIYVVFRQCKPKVSARGQRKVFMEALRQSKFSKISRLAFLEENEGVLLLEMGGSNKKDKLVIEKLIKSFKTYMEEKCEGLELEFGICREERTLEELRGGIWKCQEVMKKGKMLFPGEQIWDYEGIGPFVWLNIPEKELEEMLKEYRQLLKDERNIELLRTLKVYLENNMNYSIAAEKMYVHVNTIRKRMDKVEDLLDIRWEQPIDRLKTEILLQYLGLEEG